MEQNRTRINKDRLLKALENSLGVVTTALKTTDLSRTNFHFICEFNSKGNSFRF